MKLSPYLLKSTATAALGGLLFGFDTAVISGVTSALRQNYHLGDDLLGITVSSALWGTVFGSLFASIPGDRWGRRDSLRVLAIFYLISALGCAFAWSWPVLLISRVLGGIAIGGSSVLGPMYIAELAPPQWRGRLVGIFQFNVVFGILAAYLSNFLVGQAGLGDLEWRWKLGVSALPALLFFFLLYTIPRSPRWLASKDRYPEALQVLTASGAENPQQLLSEIKESIDEDRRNQQTKLFTRNHLFPIFLAGSIGLFNQLSGINAILYYLNDIFAAAGFSKVSSDLQAVLIGATNLAATMFGLSVIDKFGRKALLLGGGVGLIACLAGVAYVFLTHTHNELLIVFLVIYIASFALSQGAVIWVYIGEVFPNQVRAKGQSLGCSAHWIANAIISGVYPVLAAKSGGYPFVFFALMMVVQFFTVLVVYPETKGMQLENANQLAMH